MSAPKTELLHWLLNNLHKLEVHTDVVYCDEMDAPARSLRSVELHGLVRDWSIKSQSKQRLLEKLYDLMESDSQRLATAEDAPLVSSYRCETCQNAATVHIEIIGFHFCASCLAKIDARIAEINKR